jgi:hypothetical protein
MRNAAQYTDGNSQYPVARTQARGPDTVHRLAAFGGVLPRHGARGSSSDASIVEGDALTGESVLAIAGTGNSPAIRQPVGYGGLFRPDGPATGSSSSASPRKNSPIAAGGRRPLRAPRSALLAAALWVEHDGCEFHIFIVGILRPL